MKRSKHIGWKWLLIVPVIVGILFLVFRFTPIYTIYNFSMAAKESNTDGMIKCVEPTKAEGLQTMASYIEMLPIKDILASINAGNAGKKGKLDFKKLMKLKFKVKHIGFNYIKGKSMVQVSCKTKENKTFKAKINFVRKDINWYIDSVSDIIYE